MSNLFVSAITTILVFIFAHGASVKNCTVAPDDPVYACDRILSNFVKTLSTLHLDDKQGMSNFKTQCEKVSECIDRFSHCPIYKANQAANEFDAFKPACAILQFADNEFRNCNDKLIKDLSECYKNWKLFENDEKLTKKENVEEVCANFFGEGQCLKKEIMEVCSVKDWEMFRDFVLGLNDAVKQCNFYEVI